MKKMGLLLLFLIYSLTFPQQKNLISTANLTDSLSNYCPLKLGNAYEYIKYVNGLPGCNKLIKFSIDKDTIINSNRYFLVNNIWERVDSGKLYTFNTVKNQEQISMDFNLNDGDTLNSNPISTGTTEVFGKILPWKKIESEYRGMNEFSYSSSKWVYGFGELFKGHQYYYPGTDFITEQTSIIQLIKVEGDSILFYSHNEYPVITYLPQDTITNLDMNISIKVDHDFSNLYSMCVPFQFTESIIIDAFYQLSDSVVALEPKLIYSQYDSPYFEVILNLDSALLKNGFSYYYKITAKDKGIIPHYSYSPDSGFYRVIYSPLADLNGKLRTFSFSLSQNYPNPFNPSTKIQYAVGSKQFVTLAVYDILGREVITLVNEEKPAGEYDVEFNASSLSSGIYFYQLQSGNSILTKKMIYLK